MQFKTRQEVIDILGKEVKLDQYIPIARRVIKPDKIKSIVKIIAIHEIEESKGGFINLVDFFTHPEKELDKFTYVIFWCKQENGSYVQVVSWEIERTVEIALHRKKTYM